MKSRSIITVTMITALCVLLSVLSIVPVIRAYSSPVADPGTILINARSGGSSIAGMPWRVYFIGARGELGDVVLTESFASSGIVIDELTEDNIKSATAQLSAYISDHEIAADYVCDTDSSGSALIENAAEGVYFFESDTINIAHTIYTPSPALAEMKPGEGLSILPKIESRPEDSYNESGGDADSSRGDIETDSDGDNSSHTDSGFIPSEDDSSLLDSDDSRYTDSSDISTPSGSDKDSSGKNSSGSGSTASGGSNASSQNGGSSGTDGLPQTGQLWWPVPVLAIGGLVLIALGARVSSAKGKENDE